MPQPSTCKRLESLNEHMPLSKKPQSRKMETDEQRSTWDYNVISAVLYYITTYITSIVRQPSRVFLGRFPCNFLDMKLDNRPRTTPMPKSQVLQVVLDYTEMIFQDIHKTATQACIKCKPWYDKKNLKTKKTRLRVCHRAQSNLPRNSSHKISVDWSLNE